MSYNNKIRLSYTVVTDARINAHVLLNLNESRLERFGVSMGFQFAMMSVIEDLVCSSESVDYKCHTITAFTGIIICNRKETNSLLMIGRHCHHSNSIQQEV